MLDIKNIILAAAAAGIAANAAPAPPAAAAVTVVSPKYDFITINNRTDLTFNQLLGINNDGLIAGYYGSGADAQHPNKGYLLPRPYSKMGYVNGNVPYSVQTQDTCINNHAVFGGFWVDANGINHGFVHDGDAFRTIDNPRTGGGTVNQILGINDQGIAVGFYTDGNDVNHGYTYDTDARRFTDVVVPTCTSTTATAINNRREVVGFCTTAAGAVVSFFIDAKGLTSTTFVVPGNTADTMALGLNDDREVVGSFVDSNGAMHGFIVSIDVAARSASAEDFRQLDHPRGTAGTVLNGLNDHGELVGFYVDGAGNTNGLLALPNGSGKTKVIGGLAASSTVPRR